MQREHRRARQGRRPFGWLVVLLAVLLGARAVRAAGPDPSLGAFHILDSLSPAHRRQIVQSVQNAMATPGTAPAPAVPVKPVPAPAAALRLAPGDTVLLHYEAADPTRPVPDRTLFVLDQSGRLSLPNGAAVSLAGLSEREAAWRLESEPGLRGLRVIVRVLPRPPGLQPFGYTLFAAAPRSPFTYHGQDLPADYRLMPGDELSVRWSDGHGLHHGTFRVGHDGSVVIPGLGPVAVAAHRFRQAAAAIVADLDRHDLKPGAAVALARLHRIRILVLGDVQRPGAYALSPFARVTDALFASGGPTTRGTLRAITLKRQGQQLGTFDLYPLLLQGDTDDDPALASGEVVFVPPLGPTVSVAGAVLRPARYELKGPETLSEVLAMAGGLEADANRQGIAIERIAPRGERVLLNADLDTPTGKALVLTNGDAVRVSTLGPTLHQVVRLEGDVERPRVYPWVQGMRLTDLLANRTDLRANADTHYILMLKPQAVGGVHFVQADWTAAAAAPGGPANPAVNPGDRVYVFSLDAPRAPLIAHLRRHAEALSGITHYVPMVDIRGSVRFPGAYPLTPDLALPGLLAASGGVIADPALLEVLVTGPEGRVVGAGPLPAMLTQAPVRLAQGDRVEIRARTHALPATIEIAGAVRRPGRYPVAPNAVLSGALAAAGGARPGAALADTVIMRPALAARRHAEALQMLAAMNRGPAGTPRDVAALLAGPLSGRVRSCLTPANAPAQPVMEGDRITVLEPPATLAVAGWVKAPRVLIYQPGLRPRDLVALAQGLRPHADARHLMIRRANGCLVPVADSWFHHTRVHAGDALIVLPALPGLPRGIDRARLRVLLAFAIAP